MRHPPRGQIWVHVDRLDRDDGKVWAVQYYAGRKARYDVAAGVVLNGQSYTKFFGKGLQPRAVIVVEGGTVTMQGDVAVIANRPLPVK